MNTPDLEALEQRVINRYIDHAKAQWPTAENQITLDTQQWVTHPNSRTIALMFADHLIDMWDQLDDNQHNQLVMLIAYGGRELKS